MMMIYYIKFELHEVLIYFCCFTHLWWWLKIANSHQYSVFFYFDPHKFTEMWKFVCLLLFLLIFLML